jgi:hypothetical protein
MMAKHTGVNFWEEFFSFFLGDTALEHASDAAFV